MGNNFVPPLAIGGSEYMSLHFEQDLDPFSYFSELSRVPGTTHRHTMLRVISCNRPKLRDEDRIKCKHVAPSGENSYTGLHL